MAQSARGNELLIESCPEGVDEFMLDSTGDTPLVDFTCRRAGAEAVKIPPTLGRAYPRPRGGWYRCSQEAAKRGLLTVAGLAVEAQYKEAEQTVLKMPCRLSSVRKAEELQYGLLGGLSIHVPGRRVLGAVAVSELHC